MEGFNFSNSSVQHLPTSKHFCNFASEIYLFYFHEAYMQDSLVDIKVNEGYELSEEVWNTLLKDHTLSSEECQVNIFWATDNYVHLGEGYQYGEQITVEAITGSNKDIIQPRSSKTRQQQQQRSREMAEVFTPSWVCNKQNNLVDNAWFGREDVFNTEIDDFAKGEHLWRVNAAPIVFPEGKTWLDYVTENRLEITCGEAPFLANRYDRVTGESIPIEKRVGLLDRKLRVVSENTSTSAAWLKAAQDAYQSIYGYEWQGDNLVLARKTLLFTFIDYYRNKFGKLPTEKSIRYIAYIISWNIWQMDGLKGVIPNTCGNRRTVVYNLFGDSTETITHCEGCKTGNIKKHNGTYALIKDWNASKSKQKIRFIDLIK